MSTWDSLSPQQRASLVDAGRAHEDGSPKHGRGRWFTWAELSDEELEAKRLAWAALPCLRAHGLTPCDRCEALDGIEDEQSKRRDQRAADALEDGR